MLVLKSLLFGLFVGLMAAYASLLWRKRKLIAMARKIPGSDGWPLIGVAHKMIGAKNFCKTLLSWTEVHGSPAKMWVGPHECMVVVDLPEDLKIVQNSPKTLGKPSLYSFFHVDNSILSIPVDAWKVHRKILNPMFSISNLKAFIPIFNDKSQRLLQNLDTKVDAGSEFDVYDYVAACSLETLLFTMMGINRDCQSTPENDEQLINVEE